MAGGFKKECRCRVKVVVLDRREATMGGSGLREHYIVEISVGDAFLDIRRKLEFVECVFSTWLVLLLCRSS